MDSAPQAAGVPVAPDGTKPMGIKDWLAFFERHAPPDTPERMYIGLLKYISDQGVYRYNDYEHPLPAIVTLEQMRESYRHDAGFRHPFYVTDLLDQILYRSRWMVHEDIERIDALNRQREAKLAEMEQDETAKRERFVARAHQFLDRNGHRLTDAQVDGLLAKLRTLRTAEP